MNQVDAVHYPNPADADLEEVHCSLSVGAALWARGDGEEALKWLRRAAEAAADSDADRRAVELFKNRTDIGELKLAKARTRSRQHRTIGLCAGSGGSLLGEAIAQGCTLYLTGEMSHHDLLKAQAAGCTVLLAGHTDTERGYLPVLARRLASELGTETASFLISRRDRRPLRTV